MELTKEQQEKILEFESAPNVIKIDKEYFCENDFYTCVERIKITVGKKNSIRYEDIVVCKHCGDVKKISSGTINHCSSCQRCAAIKHRADFVGFENIAYKVLEFVRSDKKRKLYYKCQCKNCGSILTVRKDVIVAATACHCAKCVGNSKKPTTEVAYNVSRGNYKRAAIFRGLSWDLSPEEFKDIVSKPCHYCGAEPVQKNHLKRYMRVETPVYLNGVDRVNSKLGYSVDNCVPCCEKCNRMKLDYSKEDFLSHIEKIYKFHKSATTIENTDNSGSE
jgi:hypothetical protein